MSFFSDFLHNLIVNVPGLADRFLDNEPVLGDLFDVLCLALQLVLDLLLLRLQGVDLPVQLIELDLLPLDLLVVVVQLLHASLLLFSYIR